MNWMEDMNNALDYIEENIENDITSDEIARVAHLSKFYFLRIFNVLTGITLCDYIRQRRLSLAARDVVLSDMKIIDIAYKYGYETPEAFTKAFKKLQDISPSEARKKGKNLKAIPPISFQITVKGEKRMEYKIISKEEFKIAGASIRITTKNGDNFKEIPKFWDKTFENGTYAKLDKNKGDLGILGVCYDYDCENEKLSYIIAVEGDKVEGLDRYDVINIPKSSWAVFESVGPMPGAIQKVWHKIYAEWFPATKYEHAGGPELEVYLPGDASSEDYRCEVWIPIIEK